MVAADLAHAQWLKSAADDLGQHRGTALVHAGREQPLEVHVLADAINGALGAFGKTVRLISPVEAAPASKPQSLAELAEDMKSGKVDTLLILGSIPAYDAPADLDFESNLRRLTASVSLALYEDETALASTWRLPATHEYETWGDVRAFDGTVTIQQPQTRPLYGGHSPQQVLAVLTGNTSPDGYNLPARFWQQRAQQEGPGLLPRLWHEGRLRHRSRYQIPQKLRSILRRMPPRLLPGRLPRVRRLPGAAGSRRCSGRMREIGTAGTRTIRGCWRCPVRLHD